MSTPQEWRSRILHLLSPHFEVRESRGFDLWDYWHLTSTPRRPNT